MATHTQTLDTLAGCHELARTLHIGAPIGDESADDWTARLARLIGRDRNVTLRAAVLAGINESEHVAPAAVLYGQDDATIARTAVLAASHRAAAGWTLDTSGDLDREPASRRKRNRKGASVPLPAVDHDRRNAEDRRGSGLDRAANAILRAAEVQHALDGAHDHERLSMVLSRHPHRMDTERGRLVAWSTLGGRDWTSTDEAVRDSLRDALRPCKPQTRVEYRTDGTTHAYRRTPTAEASRVDTYAASISLGDMWRHETAVAACSDETAQRIRLAHRVTLGGRERSEHTVYSADGTMTVFARKAPAQRKVKSRAALKAQGKTDSKRAAAERAAVELLAAIKTWADTASVGDLMVWHDIRITLTSPATNRAAAQLAASSLLRAGTANGTPRTIATAAARAHVHHASLASAHKHQPTADLATVGQATTDVG